jgi:hypothetical protein
VNTLPSPVVIVKTTLSSLSFQLINWGISKIANYSNIEIKIANIATDAIF